MTIHKSPSPLAGRRVRIKPGVAHPEIPNFGGSEIFVEDWWDRVHGRSWMAANGDPPVLAYLVRTGFAGHRVPIDNEVLCGRVGHLGCLVHVSELDLETESNKEG